MFYLIITLVTHLDEPKKNPICYYPWGYKQTSNNAILEF